MSLNHYIVGLLMDGASCFLICVQYSHVRPRNRSFSLKPAIKRIVSASSVKFLNFLNVTSALSHKIQTQKKEPLHKFQGTGRCNILASSCCSRNGKSHMTTSLHGITTYLSAIHLGVLIHKRPGLASSPSRKTRWSNRRLEASDMEMIKDHDTVTNTSVGPDARLLLPDLALDDEYIYPVFLTGTLVYLLIMLFNLLVLASIAVCKLHTPMFILLCNLPISDMLGATAFFPHLLLRIVTGERIISFPACIVQMFLVHTYGTGNLVILCFMAYDRYVAICHPLKYNTIIGPNTLLKMTVAIWFFIIPPVLLLCLMQRQLTFCRIQIVDLFCNNPSIVRLSCGDTRPINYVGMSMNIVYQSTALGILLVTYLHILRTCIITNVSDAWKKAIQTCSTHLAVYFVLEISLFLTLLSHRLEVVSPSMRKVLGIFVLIFPPLLDPLIYALNTKQLKDAIMIFLKKTFISPKF
ncbi:olfactory receptor 2AT4-like [Synchiropus splendidus]|uniref:olfactory receptor 2AT4-like n=1 Tax=Synchiropus splendidus TaxID=270530 RepID=UPI00237E2D49|nr:olfactory receptor 2AT4-like [Synchiropus splendidus]